MAVQKVKLTPISGEPEETLDAIDFFAAIEDYTDKVNDIVIVNDKSYWLSSLIIIDNGGVGSIYARNQFSNRFNEQVNVTSAEEALDFILFPYAAPLIALSGNPGSQVKELGVLINSVQLSATTTKKTKPITSVQFFRGTYLLYTVPVPNANGGVEIFTENNPVNTTTSFTVKVSDGTQTITSNAITFTYVYPYYYGVGAQGLTAVQIQALTKLVKTQSNTTAVTSPNNQVYYFAYPAAYPALTSVLDQNGFETIADYTASIKSFTMLDQTTQNYRVYEFKNLTTQNNFANTYKH